MTLIELIVVATIISVALLVAIPAVASWLGGDVRKAAREMGTVMQAAYDERQRSMDYIDYQRSSYIRGEQDWISEMEGGAVYHTDSWGTKNTATGEYYEGQPYDYVHFKGENPKYNEQITPINSRELWERHVE